MGGRLLVVDDDAVLCDLIEKDLRRRQIEARTCQDPVEALRLLREEDFDVVLTDVRLPGVDGIELSRRIAEERPDIPVVVMTAFGSLDTAVGAIRAGAYDFVTKPVEMEILFLVLQRAQRHRDLQEKVRVLRATLERMQPFEELWGESRPMQQLFEQITRVADLETSVLITGESGTGKELVARALHSRSRRRSGPFVALNCAALPETLLESELFGHVRGAFTDARSDHPGVFQQAHGGTLFLDEVGELPPSIQPKLLRSLEERVVRPLGSTGEVAFDARLITATNRDLEGDLDAGRFRPDLFFRIAVVPLSVPPLRARGNDILLLAHRFLEQFARRMNKAVAGLSEPFARHLLDYPWPGNVRELRNAIEHAVALTPYERLGVEGLPERIRFHRRSPGELADSGPAELEPLADVERRHILRVLKAVGGNKARAARVLGLDRKTLFRKLQRYERSQETEGLP